MSRRPRPTDLPGGREWRTADLGRDDLAPVVEGADAVIHLASEKGSGATDVDATRRLLEAATVAGSRHVVVVSIIGCDRIPLPFYASKVAIEAVVRASPVPWSIIRIAQFHSFVERLVSSVAGAPVPAPIVADLRFQSVDEREAAEALVDVALGPALGDAPEVAGPRVQALGEIASTWLRVTGGTAKLIPISLDDLAASRSPGPSPAPWALDVLAGYRAAHNTPHGKAILGHVDFESWLRRQWDGGA